MLGTSSRAENLQQTSLIKVKKTQKWVRFYGGNNFCFPSDLLPSLGLKSLGFVVYFFLWPFCCLFFPENTFETLTKISNMCVEQTTA